MRLLIVALVVAVAWLAAGAATLLSAADEVSDIRAQVRDLRRDLTVASLVDGTAEERLREVRSNLVSVNEAANSPLTLPLRIVPGIHRQVESARVLTSSGLAAADSGLQAFGEVQQSLEGPLPVGTDRIALLERIEGALGQSRRDIVGLPLGPSGPLFDELADARDVAAEGLDDIDEFLTSAEAITRSVRSLLSDGDVLLVAANNAEMRSGSGMFLQAGMLTGVDGDLRAADLLPASEIQLPRDAVRAESETYDDRWGFLLPTVEWRNLAASPRFDVTAELATRMWEGLGNERPNGVLAVDPFALAALLRATGPVEVDGRMIDHEGVVDFLLHDQYDVFAGTERGEVDETQEERRDQLGDIADASLAELGGGDVDPVELLEGLQEAIRGRHLLAWSVDEDVQEGWRAAGMAGELEENSLMVSVLNRGANKLDPFLDVSVDVDFASTSDGDVLGTLDIQLRNQVPEGEVRYVAGPAPGVAGVTGYGQYKGFLSVALPRGSYDARIDGVDDLLVAGRDGPVLTLAAEFVIGRRATETFRVTFELPGPVQSVRLEPAARPTPVAWTVGDARPVRDGRHHRIPVEPTDG